MKGKGFKKIHRGYWLFWSRVDEKERAKEGVGLIIAPNRLKDVIQEEYVNELLLVVKMKLMKDQKIWSIITVYGENEDARNKNDYFLVSKNKWKIMQDTKVKREAEIGSDHFLVIMRLKKTKEENTDKRRRKVNEKIKSHKLREEK